MRNATGDPHKAAYLAVVLVPILLAVAVCGSQDGAMPSGAPDALGTVHLTVHWPGTQSATAPEVMTVDTSGQQVSARLIPPRAYSVTVDVTGAGISPVISETVARPMVKDAETELDLHVPPGTGRTVTVTARDAAGDTLASRSTVVNVTAGVTTDVALQLAPDPTGLSSVSPWPKHGGDRGNTGRSQAVGAQAANVRWEFVTLSWISGGAAIAPDGTIYFGSGDGRIHALNPDGSERGSINTGDWVTGTPAIGADSTIYIGSYNSTLYAVGANGSTKWGFAPPGDRLEDGPAIGADGTIYVASDDSNLYAVNPTTGAEAWHYTAGDDVRGCPAIAPDGTLYVGSLDDNLHAVNPDGSGLSQYTTDADIVGSPALGTDGTVYIGSTENRLHAVSPGGTQRWTYTTGGDILGGPAIGADGAIYVGSLDNSLHAVNPDGSARWTFPTGHDIRCTPAIGADGTICITSWDTNVYAVNADGTQKWVYDTGVAAAAADPAIGADGTLYVGSENNRFLAIGP